MFSFSLLLKLVISQAPVGSSSFPNTNEEPESEEEQDPHRFPERTLPPNVPRHPGFSRWYRRFPIPAPVDVSKVKFTGKCS